jgi:hypothetical protein
MKRSWIAAIAGIMSLALAVAVPVAAASNGTTVAPKATTLPALYTVKLTGTGKGGKQFRGTYAIQRFVAGRRAVYAVGTLRGTLKGRHITRYDVMMPATLTGSGSGSAARAAQASCSILHLVIGPINLNLLGLRITTNRIVVDITAVPGAGNLLGNLLCDLTNALNQGGALSQLNSDLQQLAATLTSLTSLLGGL